MDRLLKGAAGGMDDSELGRHFSEGMTRIDRQGDAQELLTDYDE